MKKVIILILMLMCVDVNALEIETKYTDFSEYIEGYKEPSDLVNLEEYYKYKYYNNEVILGGYYVYNENPKDYPYIDLNDSVEVTYDSGTILPLEMPNRIIEKKDLYYYQDMKEIRYIFLYDINGSNTAITIGEIDVFVAGKKIEYDIECTSCGKPFLGAVNDDVYVFESGSYVRNNNYVVIDLLNYYPAESIDFIMYAYSFGDANNQYSIAYTKEPNLDKKYLFKSSSFSFSSTSLNDLVEIKHNIDDMEIGDAEYYDYVVSDEPITSNKTRNIYVESNYKYTDKLYKYNDLIQVYSEEYLDEGSSQFPYQSDDKKVYYKHRIRSIINVEEEIPVDPEIIIHNQNSDEMLVEEKPDTAKEPNFVYNNMEIIEEEKDIDEDDFEVKPDSKEDEEQLIVEPNEQNNVLKMMAIPFAIVLIIPTYIYFKSEYNKE